MSDNNHKPSDPEHVKRIIDDVFKASGFAARKGPKAPTPNEQVLLQAHNVNAKVYALMKTVLQADHARGGKYSPDSAFAMIFKLSQEEFAKWSKDDLLFLCTEVHAEYVLSLCNDFAASLL